MVEQFTKLRSYFTSVCTEYSVHGRYTAHTPNQPKNTHAHHYLFFDCLYVNLLRVLSDHQVSFIHFTSFHFTHQKTENRKQKPENERENIRNILPQFPPHHLLRDSHLVVMLPVVHCEPQPDEVRQDGGRSFLRSDRGRVWGWRELAREGKAVYVVWLDCIVLYIIFSLRVCICVSVEVFFL